jgi:hypothetical protein
VLPYPGADYDALSAVIRREGTQDPVQENLIHFWRRCPLDGPPYWHPDDRPYLNRYGDAVPLDFESFLQSTRFGDFNDKRFHLSLLPVPFLGDLRRATVLILLLNPGFAFANYYETTSHAYMSRLRRNMQQDFAGTEFPFKSLDPQFCWHPGFMWWERKFRDILTSVASAKFNGSYRDALRHLANRVAAVELVPYHSSSFVAGPLVSRLPSAHMARQYVQDVAQKGDKLIIVTRSAANWGLKPRKGRIIVYSGGHTRGASLSRRSEGGEVILDRLL